MIQKVAKNIRTMFLSAAQNVGLFVFTAFFVTGTLCMEPMAWYRTQIDLVNQYVVLPWGMALCLLRLERRRNALNDATRRDVQALFALLLWIVVPFVLRFGITFNNVGAWYNHTVVYFGIYAFLSEMDGQEREKTFDLFVLLCGVMTFILSGALLYCAATATTIYAGAQSIGFGLMDGAHICHGVHYNLTGMLLTCLAMISMAGVSRAKRLPLRVFFGISALMALIVVVLTQSRTARYASLIALGAGVYGVIVGRAPIKKRAICQLTAIAAAVVVLVGGYIGAAKMTDAALSHYADVRNQAQAMARAEKAKAQTVALAQESEPEETDGQAISAQESAEQNAVEQNAAEQNAVEQAVAEEEKEVQADTAAQDVVVEEEMIEAKTARKAVDSTFSDRTKIWQNLFNLWKEDIKYLFIGNGIGRTGSRVVEGTIHEKAGAVQLHNTYLQHTADFGLIGTALLAFFFALLVRPLLRVFFASGSRRKPGYTALMMLVLAMLATGLMESAPLGGLSPANMMLFFALALLAGRGEDLAHL